MVPSTPESLAILLIALVDGVQLQWLLDRDSVDREAGSVASCALHPRDSRLIAAGPG